MKKLKKVKCIYEYKRKDIKFISVFLVLMLSYLGNNYQDEITLKNNIVIAYEHSINEIIRINNCEEKEKP